MSNKLELFELAGYLPWGLKVQNRLGIGAPNIVELSIFNCHPLLVHPEALKPLVKPLNKLTESEWVQVFKAGFDNSRIDHSSHFSDWVIGDRIYLKYRGMELYYDIERRFFMNTDIAFSQLAAFQELYKLHADIHGLIERGCGIDKTMVK